MKAYFTLCIVMGVNAFLKIVQYWSNDAFLDNTAIKTVMTRNRLQEISQFLHMNDSTEEPLRGDQNYNRLYKVRPILTAFQTISNNVIFPLRTLTLTKGWLASRDDCRSESIFRWSQRSTELRCGSPQIQKTAMCQTLLFILGVRKETRCQTNGLGYDVVMSTVRPYFNTNRHVYFDNLFSSPRLLEHLRAQTLLHV